MSNNKTCFEYAGIYIRKVKCPAVSKICNKCKKIGHHLKFYKTKQKQKCDKHKDNRKQNLHLKTLNRTTHSLSDSHEHKNYFADEVYSDNEDYLSAVKICLKIKFSKLEKIL